MIHCGSYQRMDGLRDGVMTLSRLSHTGEPDKVRSLYAEPVFGTPKVTLISTYQLSPDKTLLVANVHSTLFRSLGRAREEIDQLIARIQSHIGPMIVAGDFNTFQERYLLHLKDCLLQVGLANGPYTARSSKKRLSKTRPYLFKGLIFGAG
jgi:endonuclease/exonuclease/phosphatase (EEP) superfamily protein YafD